MLSLYVLPWGDFKLARNETVSLVLSCHTLQHMVLVHIAYASSKCSGETAWMHRRIQRGIGGTDPPEKSQKYRVS